MKRSLWSHYRFQPSRRNDLEETYPQLEDLLISFSAILQSKILGDLENDTTVVCSKSIIFFNDDHFASFHTSAKENTQVVNQIFLFVRNLYFTFSLSVECCTLMLAYILKFLRNSKIPLFHKNWKNIVLSATMIAQKLCSDEEIRNLDFLSVLPDLEIGNLNNMETEFFGFLGFQYEIDRRFYEECFFIMYSAWESEFVAKWKIDNEKVDNIFSKMVSFSKKMEDGQHGRQIFRVDAIIFNDNDLI